MNKWLFFLGGVVSGIILTMVVIFLFTRSDGYKTETEEVDNLTENLKLFDRPGDIIDEQSLLVIQVLSDNAALANGKGYEDIDDYYFGNTYLIYNNKDNHYYYDDEIIKPSKGQVFRQVGIFRYPTKDGIIKTVPVVMVMDLNN